MKGALINGGSDALNANSLNSSVAGRYDFQVRNGSVVGTAPEPGTVLLLAAGAACVVLSRRRKSS